MNLPYLKEALSALTKRPATEREFPAAPAGYRGRLVYDPTLCINCGMCMRVCSPGAITKEVRSVEEGDEITFTINLSSCTFCAMCADFCAKHAITLSGDYRMVGERPEDLLVTGTFVKKPIPKKSL